MQEGKPSQNGYIEGFNKTCRDKVFSAYSFDRESKRINI
ncbi:MAG: transposase [Bacteroidales bacterium]|nr:transposase [Bacteroidales bacterium]